MTVVHVVCSVLLYTICAAGIVLGATFIAVDAQRRYDRWRGR